MKVNIGKLLMAVAIVLVAWLLLSLPDDAFGQPLVNPVLDHLDAAKISYIAKMEKSTLVIYLVDGQPDLEQLADLANLYDVRVEVRDLRR